MGLLDGVLGGIVGAELTHVVGGLIQKHGGLPGLVNQFQQKGLGGVVQSWVGTGANQPISVEQLHNVLGVDTIAQMASKMGVNPEELSKKLAELLPQTVDKMTPGGVIPKA
jgi:uncharacterized protein YidB (DUF937 family)